MVNAFGENRRARLRNRLRCPQDVYVAFAKGKTAYAGVDIDRSGVFGEIRRNSALSRQYQLVALQDAKPCRFGPADLAQFIKNCADNRGEIARVGDLLGDGV